MEGERMKKSVLLYSGGMDSWLVEKLCKPDHCLYVHVGSPYDQAESRRLPILCSQVWLDGLQRFERDSDLILPYRNAYFILAAANFIEENYPLEEGEVDEVEIMMGATAGDRVLDKSPEFAHEMTTLLNYMNLPQHWTGQNCRRFTVSLPVKHLTKTQMVAEYLKRGGTLEEVYEDTFSCYHPLPRDKECNRCKPCFRKYVALTLNGFTMWENEEVVLGYILNEIWPSIQAGTYGRAEEEQEIRSVLKMKGLI
jgi:7-cyano-7-deazaguanine synthase